MSDPPPHPPTLCPDYYYKQLSFLSVFSAWGSLSTFHPILCYHIKCPEMQLQMYFVQNSQPPDCLKLSLSLLCYLSHQTLLPHFWLLTVQKLYTLGKSDSTPGRSSLVCSRAVPPTMLGPLPLLWKPDLLSKASPQASVFSERPCGPGWSNRSLWDP